MNAIGNKIKLLRESLGLTQADFSKKVKLSQSAISQFEDGKRSPSIQALEKISEGCGVSIETLLGKSQKHSENPDKDMLVSSIASTLQSIDVSTLKSLNLFIGDLSKNKVEGK